MKATKMGNPIMSPVKGPLAEVAIGLAQKVNIGQTIAIIDY
jgi:biotin carboxyl carrier protein